MDTAKVNPLNVRVLDPVEYRSQIPEILFPNLSQDPVTAPTGPAQVLTLAVSYAAPETMARALTQLGLGIARFDCARALRGLMLGPSVIANYPVADRIEYVAMVYLFVDSALAQEQLVAIGGAVVVLDGQEPFHVVYVEGRGG